MTATLSGAELDAHLAERTAAIAEQVKATPYSLMMVLASRDLIFCPRCKAWPRTMCTTDSGIQAWSVHAARRRAVEAMSDEQRIATYARWKAEQDWTRAESDRHLADPQMQARMTESRAAVNAAFDEIRERQRVEESAMYERCRSPWLHVTDCGCKDPAWVAPPPPAVKPYGTAVVADLAQERERRSR